MAPHGYARSNLTDEDLRDRLRPFLEKSETRSAQAVTKFLEKVQYQGGTSYGDKEAYTAMLGEISGMETFHAGEANVLYCEFSVP